MNIDPKKLEAANKILASFSGSIIEPRANGFYIMWTNYRGVAIEKRWQTRCSDYPTWHHVWGQGGTTCKALSQLIRWLRGQPVLPLSVWKYWSGQSVKLFPPESVIWLEEAGYPTEARCIKCGKSLERFDWWDLGKISGPGCYRECARSVVHSDKP